MPLSPEGQRKRRAAIRAQAEPEKKRRKRCDNCGGFFYRNRKNQRFCKKQCKDEFHRCGSAFGPLKDWLLKQVREMAFDHFRLLEERIRKLESLVPHPLYRAPG